jgi:DNA-binding transcriptional MerR regulator
VTDSFTSTQVCNLTGITYRQLDHWGRTKQFEASLSPAHGSGSRRVYSKRDVMELNVVKQLLDAGMTLQAATTGIECMRGGHVMESRTCPECGPVKLIDNDGDLMTQMSYVDKLLSRELVSA